MFPVWSVIIGILALTRPEYFLWFGKDTIGYGLAIIMLGMGMTLELKDFLQVWKSPKIIGIGVLPNI